MTINYTAELCMGTRQSTGLMGDIADKYTVDHVFMLWYRDILVYILCDHID